MMKKTGLLLLLVFSLCAQAFSVVHDISLIVRSPSTDLQVITPENVKDLSLLTSMGQGIFTGALDLQPGGDLVAAVTESGIALLDINSGKQISFIPIGFLVTALSISPDGQTLAVLYNVPTGKMMQDSTVGFNGPESRRTIALYSLPNGEQIGSEITELQECSRSNVWQMAFSADGKSLLFEKKYGDTKSDRQKLFCKISLASGKIIATLAVPADSETALSPDGRFAAVVELDQEYMATQASIYETGSFSKIKDISFPAIKWPAISFTRQGAFVLRYSTGENDSAPHIVQFWSLPEGKSFLKLEEKEQYAVPAFPGLQNTEPYDRIMSEDISPDGLWVVTGSQNGKVKLWDAKTGEMKKELGVLTWNSFSLTGNPAGGQTSQLNSYVNPVAFSSDGNTILAAENMTTMGQTGQIHIYQMLDGKEKAVFYGESIGDENIGLAFSPDSSQIVYGGFSDGSAEVHNVADGGLVLRLSGHGALVNQAQYSPDGNWIATASDDHTIRLWDASTGKLVRVFNGHTARVNQLAFSPDSMWLVSGADDNSIRRWLVEDGNLMETRSLGDENWRIEFLTVLADGHSVLYTANKYPSPLTGFVTRQILWDVQTGKETQVGGNKITIWDMAKDGKTFAGYDENSKVIGTLDSSGKMTLIATGIRSPYGNGALVGSAFTADNRLLFSGNGFGLQTWELKGSSVSFLALVAVGEPVPTYSNLYEVSPDGKVLAFANGGVVYLMGVHRQ